MGHFGPCEDNCVVHPLCDACQTAVAARKLLSADGAERTCDMDRPWTWLASVPTMVIRAAVHWHMSWEAWWFPQCLWISSTLYLACCQVAWGLSDYSLHPCHLINQKFNWVERECVYVYVCVCVCERERERDGGRQHVSGSRAEIWQVGFFIVREFLNLCERDGWGLEMRMLIVRKLLLVGQPKALSVLRPVMACWSKKKVIKKLRPESSKCAYVLVAGNATAFITS